MNLLRPFGDQVSALSVEAPKFVAEDWVRDEVSVLHVPGIHMSVIIVERNGLMKGTCFGAPVRGVEWPDCEILSLVDTSTAHSS
jgi:hypothetical protein